MMMRMIIIIILHFTTHCSPPAKGLPTPYPDRVHRFIILQILPSIHLSVDTFVAVDVNLFPYWVRRVVRQMPYYIPTQMLNEYMSWIHVVFFTYEMSVFVLMSSLKSLLNTRGDGHCRCRAGWVERSSQQPICSCHNPEWVKRRRGPGGDEKITRGAALAWGDETEPPQWPVWRVTDLLVLHQESKTAVTKTH